MQTCIQSTHYIKYINKKNESKIPIHIKLESKKKNLFHCRADWDSKRMGVGSSPVQFGQTVINWLVLPPQKSHTVALVFRVQKGAGVQTLLER